MPFTTQPETRRIGFAGLGAMGLGMALNLMKAGFDVTGFDVSVHALEKFAAFGGHTSSSISGASHGQTKFFVMVANPDQVDSLIFRDDGLNAYLPKSATLCLFSTLPPAYIVSLKARLEAAGRPDIRLLDCPVSGGVVGANSGSLSIMLGGEDATIAGLQSELEAVSAPGRLFPTGGLGSASTIKMLNQHLAGIHVVAAAETLAFAKALGLSSREAYKTLLDSEGASWILGDRGATMLNANWNPPRSAVTIFTKDLGIVKDAADGLSFPSPLASAALQTFTARAERGHGRDDDASVVCNYEAVIGAKVAEPESVESAPNLPVSYSDKRPPIVLVAPSNELASSFEQALSSTGMKEREPSVRILRSEGDSLLSSLGTLTGSLVGVTGSIAYRESYLQGLSSRFPGLQFFDYQVVLSSDHNTPQILFSVANGNIATVLQAAFAPAFSTVPVHGPVGSATAMYLSIRLGSLIHVAAAAECYSLAVARGVSVQLVLNLISGAAGSSAQFSQVFPAMVQQDFVDHSPLRHGTLGRAVGDLKELRSVAEHIKFPGILLDVTHEIFNKVHEETGDDGLLTAALTSYWGAHHGETSASGVNGARL